MEDELQSYRINLSGLEIAGARYRIIGALARGGCSVILKVEALDGGEELALKVPFRFDELFTNRQGNGATALRKSEKALWDEIHNFHRVESPHTLRCYFKGSVSVNHNGQTVTFPAILMELALANLQQILANHSRGHNPIPLDEKIKIVDHLLESTAYLHSNKLVHRDISPANIFVVRRGLHIRYIVSDFGSARHNDDIDPSRLSSSILANQYYLDPQRLRDPSFAYDPRSDVYSVGILMAEVFAGDFWHAIAGQPRKDGEPVDFQREVLKPHFKNLLDRRLRKTVAKATATHPRRRHRSIHALKASWVRFRRSVAPQRQTSPRGIVKQWVEPLLLAALSAILAVTLPPAVQFFSTPRPQPKIYISPIHTSAIIRMVMEDDPNGLTGYIRQNGYIDSFDANGWTPLHWAIYLKRLQLACFLMENGADWNAPSGKQMFDIPAGITPRQLFIRRHTRLERPARSGLEIKIKKK
jgi:serine/threonine protein kinase